MLSRKLGSDFVLNRRERDILNLIVAGRNVDEIATDLDVDGKTVEKHLSNLMRKYGLRDITPIVDYALEQGVINVYEVLAWRFSRRKS